MTADLTEKHKRAEGLLALAPGRAPPPEVMIMITLATLMMVVTRFDVSGFPTLFILGQTLQFLVAKMGISVKKSECQDFRNNKSGRTSYNYWSQ